MKTKRNKLIFVLLGIILLSSVYALESPFPGGNAVNFSVKYISEAFKFLATLLSSDYVVYGITVILYFVLFYGIFAASAGRLKIFGGGGKLNKQGKTVCVGLCGLSVIAIFYYSGGNVKQVLKETLHPFGMFGAVMLIIALWSITYFGFRDLDTSKKLRYSLVIAGMAMWILGWIFGWSTFINVGALIVLISFLVGGGIGGLMDRRIARRQAQQAAAATGGGGAAPAGYCNVTGTVEGAVGGVQRANVYFRRIRTLGRPFSQWGTPGGSEPRFHRPFSTSTGRGGNYSITLPYGRYECWAVAPNGTRSQETTNTINQPIMEIDFDIPGAAGTPAALPGRRIPIGGGRFVQAWYDQNTGNIVRVVIS
jgi:hypothetical protein